MTPGERERRRRAKRFDEGVKLAATLLNNAAVGTIIAGLLTPFVAGRPSPASVNLAFLTVIVILHLTAQVVLRLLLKSED